MEIPLLAMPLKTSQILKSVDFTKPQKSRYLKNEILFFLQIEKMGITKPCTHLHPANLSLHPALCNTLNVIRTKILHIIEQFPKNSKLSILTENWHAWSLEGADLESALRFLKFQPQNQFLGKFGSKNSKLSVLPENGHTWYLEDADSYSAISFLNFQS